MLDLKCIKTGVGGKRKKTVFRFECKKLWIVEEATSEHGIICIAKNKKNKAVK